EPSLLQTAQRGGAGGLRCLRRMARQGRQLRDPGPSRGPDPVDLRLVFQCRRTAAVRDRAAVGRPWLLRAVRRELLIGAAPGEWRAVLLEDGAAVELHVERGELAPAGSIHI